LPEYPETFWLAAAVAVLLMGISKGGFGSGIGVAATPIIALTIPAADAAALLLPLLIVADILALRQHQWQFDKPNYIQLASGALIGIAIGWFFFGYFSYNESILKLGIGILALGFVGFQLVRGALLGALSRRTPRPVEGIFWGTLAGFTSTLAHAGGPPILMHLLPQKLSRQIFVSTTVLFFFTVNVVKLIPYSQLGLLRVGNLSAIVLLSPLAYVGVQIGVALNRRFSDQWFTRVIYCGMCLTAVQLIAGRSLVGLIF
jgi:uncharacterized membrane protein YfcA